MVCDQEAKCYGFVLTQTCTKLKKEEKEPGLHFPFVEGSCLKSALWCLKLILEPLFLDSCYLSTQDIHPEEMWLP